MLMYDSTILVSMVIIAVCNFVFRITPNPNLLDISIWVVIATVAVIAIDAVFATITRWIFPLKFFSVDKNFFSASKKESLFYEKIGIKKWKDKALELGQFTGFRKNKLGDTTDNNYVERFIVEANCGIVVHLLCIIFGFAVIFVCPRIYWFSIGIPVAIVNCVLNAMSLFILRYNLPKLHVLYKYNCKRAKRNSDNKEPIEKEKSA